MTGEEMEGGAGSAAPLRIRLQPGFEHPKKTTQRRVNSAAQKAIGADTTQRISQQLLNQ
ncbi:hypothetical protein F442_07436 [Phytophthora nicotianae P10297]|uniref:Uncharacterized protein n=1 Tax=Phytophthora nicotianae P10297 TaxID=1317064 RepID=W2ZGZ0_PHYNI|nr:hypothetical protein F442_07436 [Phytophthora nicotianae P10297]